MASWAAGAPTLRRIEKICQTTADSKTLRQQLLHEIRRVVPFDAYVWLLTDPATSVGSSPLADVPCLPELPRLIRSKYLSGVNRWTHLTSSVGLLGEATAGDPARSGLWQDLLRRYDVNDVASLVFRDPFGCWAFLDLWRGSAMGTFDAADRAYLSEIAEPVTTALRRAQGRTFVEAASQQGLPRGPVVLLLSGELKVLAQTPETEEYLRILVPPDEARSPIPASAYNVAAQLLAVEADVDANPPSARVHLSAGRWLTLRAARISERRTSSFDADIAVTIEDSSPPERAELFARAYGLSSREGELLAHLITGRDSRELARLMNLSPYTVQDHLKSIFTKASVHNRRTLVARALGT